MTRRVAKAPESVRAWGFLMGQSRLMRRTVPWKSECAEHYGGLANPVRVRIVRDADYRRLLRAAAGKREAKR
jgi:hypothetical protein